MNAAKRQILESELLTSIHFLIRDIVIPKKGGGRNTSHTEGFSRYTELVNESTEAYKHLQKHKKCQFTIDSIITPLVNEGRSFYRYNEQDKWYDLVDLSNEEKIKSFARAVVMQKFRDHIKLMEEKAKISDSLATSTTEVSSDGNGDACKTTSKQLQLTQQREDSSSTTSRKHLAGALTLTLKHYNSHQTQAAPVAIDSPLPPSENKTDQRKGGRTAEPGMHRPRLTNSSLSRIVNDKEEATTATATAIATAPGSKSKLSSAPTTNMKRIAEFKTGTTESNKKFSSTRNAAITDDAQESNAGGETSEDTLVETSNILLKRPGVSENGINYQQDGTHETTCSSSSKNMIQTIDCGKCLGTGRLGEEGTRTTHKTTSSSSSSRFRKSIQTVYCGKCSS